MKISLLQQWRLTSMLPMCPSPLLNIITKAEQAVYERWGFNMWGPADLFCTTAFCFPDVVREQKQYHITVATTGKHTRGQFVLDHRYQEKPNAIVQKRFYECGIMTACAKMAAIKTYEKKCHAGRIKEPPQKTC